MFLKVKSSLIINLSSLLSFEFQCVSHADNHASLELSCETDNKLEHIPIAWADDLFAANKLQDLATQLLTEALEQGRPYLDLAAAITVWMSSAEEVQL